MANKIYLYPDYSEEIAQLDNLNGIVTSELLDSIIGKHKLCSEYMLYLYKKYRGDTDAIDIFSREPRFDNEDINNRINNDFIGEIIDTKVGYFSGEAASYNYSSDDKSVEEVGGDADYERVSQAISDFTIRSNMRDIDAETTKFASIAGYCGNYMYIDTEGNERISISLPWETIILFKQDMSEPSYGIRYYNTMREGKTAVKIEFFNDENVYFFEKTLGEGIIPDREQDESKQIQPHLYGSCPLFGIQNNYEMISDFDKVLAKIDAYDKIVSDISNEAEQFVSAYLFITGVELSEETAKIAKRIGAFSTTEANAHAEYLTKNVNTTFMMQQLETLSKKIYTDSKTPDTNEQSFNAASGISLKYKLRPLENKCIVFETKMEKSRNYMFRLLSNAWNKKTIKCNPLKCWVQFKRNMPIDRMYELQTAAQAKAMGMPAEYWLSIISDVDDINYYIDLMEQEMNNITPLNLDEPKSETNKAVMSDGTNKPSTDGSNNAGDVFGGSSTNI